MPTNWEIQSTPKILKCGLWLGYSKVGIDTQKRGHRESHDNISGAQARMHTRVREDWYVKRLSLLEILLAEGLFPGFRGLVR